MGMTHFSEQNVRRDTVGRFDEHTRSAPEAQLAVADSDCARCESPATSDDGLCDRHTLRWGSLTLKEGSRTPWGAASTVTHVAPGIAVADTPGHGGVKLSPERNREIPSALRNPSGWYEEDCEINIPLHYFPDEWARQPHVKSSADELRDDTDRAIKGWFPDKWEAANGRLIEPGESHVKDERDWLERHAGEHIVTSASTAESDPNMVVVTARVGGHDGNGEQVEYLVPRAEYASRTEPGDLGRNGRFIVDPTRHPKLPPAAKPEGAAPAIIHPRIPDTQDRSLTPTARERIHKDLAQRWRAQDGHVRTFQEVLENEGTVGKTAYLEGSSLKYHVNTPAGSYPVSKALWDSLGDVPDKRSPAQVAQQAASAYLERINKKWDATRAERERVKTLAGEAALLREREEAERVAREGTWEQKEAARKAVKAERERAARIEGAE